MNTVYNKLRKQVKDFSFIRLPSKKSQVTIRPSVSGKGYATFKKYNLVVNKALCKLHRFKDLTTVSRFCTMKDFYFETKVQ